MKPILRKFSPTGNQSFYVQNVRGKEMVNPWHYHPEVEIVYIKQSTGTTAVGDYIGNFGAGAVFVYGANLPHTTVHEQRFLNNSKKNAGHAITIHFLPDNIGPVLFTTPEMAAIKKMITITARRGLQLEGSLREKVICYMEAIVKMTPAKKLITLLSILDEIAQSKEFTALTGKGYSHNSSDHDDYRLKAVYDFTFANYNRHVYIEELAAITHLTKQSFCRFFKTTNRKTYFQFLMEVRIGQACRFLSDDKKLIADISNRCGYNNMAHFIRQFKKVTGKNPLQYKKHMQATQREMITG